MRAQEEAGGRDFVGGADRRRPVHLIDITNDLLRLLLSQEIHPGARLPSERQLASHFGVGRAVIREALKSLSLLGVIEVRPGDGNFVSGRESDLLSHLIEWGLLLGQKSTDDMMEMRHVLELVTVRFAAERRSPEDIEYLGDLVDQMDAAQDAETFLTLDIAFHQAIAEASKNEALAGVHRSVQGLLRVWIARALDEAGESVMFSDQHRAIFDQIKAGDPSAASSAMEHHLSSAYRFLTKAVQRAAGGSAAG